MVAKRKYPPQRVDDHSSCARVLDDEMIRRTRLEVEAKVREAEDYVREHIDPQLPADQRLTLCWGDQIVEVSPDIDGPGECYALGFAGVGDQRRFDASLLKRTGVNEWKAVEREPTALTDARRAVLFHFAQHLDRYVEDVLRAAVPVTNLCWEIQTSDCTGRTWDWVKRYDMEDEDDEDIDEDDSDDGTGDEPRSESPAAEARATALFLDGVPRDLVGLGELTPFKLRIIAGATGALDAADQKLKWHTFKPVDERVHFVFEALRRWDESHGAGDPELRA